jgi:hypothetical protein
MPDMWLLADERPCLVRYSRGRQHDEHGDEWGLFWGVWVETENLGGGVCSEGGGGGGVGDGDGDDGGGGGLGGGVMDGTVSPYDDGCRKEQERVVNSKVRRAPMED